MAGMPHLVWRSPVMSPASMPLATAASMATPTFTPEVIRAMHTDPPVARDPSTVRSEVFRILKVI